jgi:cold-inducible RNA-binding protein
MNTKVYVGNLPYDVTQEALKSHFETQGKVSDVHIVIDKYTDKPRGFAFVTMEDTAGMTAVLAHLDGQEFGGRTLKINEARPRENATGGPGGGGGNNRRSGGGGGGGYRQDDRPRRDNNDRQRRDDRPRRDGGGSDRGSRGGDSGRREFRGSKGW